MSANPIELIGGLATSSNVVKADIVSWGKARVAQVLADPSEVNNTNLTGQLVIYVKSLSSNYILDAADSTTANSPPNCIVSLDGKRFKPTSAVPAPTTGSLGGVFASAAVANQWVTGLDTSGNLLRTQPAAANLSNGVTGSGAVVLASGPTVGPMTVSSASASALAAGLNGATNPALLVDASTTSSETGLKIKSAAAAGGVALSVISSGTNEALIIDAKGNGGVTIAQNSSGNVQIFRPLVLGGGGFVGSVALANATSGNVVLQPATGSLGASVATLLAGTYNLVGDSLAQTLTNKGINATNNTITNLTTAMFAANVVDTDGTFGANSDTRLASQKAVKTYVDTVAQGLDPKPSVLVKTTGNVTLSGEQTVDGTLTSASRVLVGSNTTTSQNGIYVTAAGSWTRALDFDAWTEMPGAFVFVEKGTTFGDTGWVCTVDAGGTIGSTSVTFTQFSGAGTYTASTGLTLTGTAFSIDSTVATLTGAQALTNKTINGNTWTAGTGVLTLGAGKTATISNTLTFTGTDATSHAFPTTSATLARTDAAQTFTGTQNFTGNVGMTGGLTINLSSATALFVSQGANAALVVDTSTASSATGINIKSAAAAGGVALSVLSSGTNEALAIDAKGSGAVTIGQNSTGNVQVYRPFVLGGGGLVGSATFANATSGIITLHPPTGALGTSDATLPIGTYNVVGDSLTQTLTNKSLTSPVLTGTADIQQAVTHSGDITPTQIVATTNDYAPTGFSTASVVRISTDASRDITGLAAGSDGRTIYVLNVGSFAAVLKDEGAGSTAANRFGFGADLTLASKQGATLLYDSTASRWRQVGGPSASGGGSGTVTSVAGGGATITSSGTLPPQYGLINHSLAVSASAGALTIALKDNAGSDPSATSPITGNFRSPTGTTGSWVQRSVTAALSLTIASGATMAVTSATAFRLWVVLFDDAGTMRLGVINCHAAGQIFPLIEGNPTSSVALSSSSNSAGFIYSGTAVTSKSFLIVGYLDWTPTGLTAGTWTTTNLNSVQSFGPGIRKPGEVVQTVVSQTGTVATGTTTIPLDNTIPQSTEGDQYMSQAITPSAASNRLRISAQGMYSNSAAGAFMTQALFQDSAANALVTSTHYQSQATGAVMVPTSFEMVAGTTSSTTLKVRAGNFAAGTTTFNGQSGGQLYGGTLNSFVRIEEIMS